MNVDLDQTFPEERDDDADGYGLGVNPFVSMPTDELARLERQTAELLTSVEQISNDLDWYNDLDYDLFRMQYELADREPETRHADADAEDHS